MKTFILTALLILTTQFAYAETDKIDAELNSAYKTALEKSRDPNRTKTAQRLWLKFIKADCDAQSFNLGGSMGALILVEFDECIAYQKSERTKYLLSTYPKL